MVGGPISIVEIVATQLPWSQIPPKENVTLKSREQGLLIILNALGFETTDSLKVRVEKESLMVEGGAMTKPPLATHQCMRRLRSPVVIFMIKTNQSVSNPSLHFKGCLACNILLKGKVVKAGF
nr:hypothetical protein [Tanacetum cinerariifolium]